MLVPGYCKQGCILQACAAKERCAAAMLVARTKPQYRPHARPDIATKKNKTKERKETSTGRKVSSYRRRAAMHRREPHLDGPDRLVGGAPRSAGQEPAAGRGALREGRAAAGRQAAQRSKGAPLGGAQARCNALQQGRQFQRVDWGAVVAALPFCARLRLRQKQAGKQETRFEPLSRRLVEQSGKVGSRHCRHLMDATPRSLGWHMCKQGRAKSGFCQLFFIVIHSVRQSEAGTFSAAGGSAIAGWHAGSRSNRELSATADALSE